MTGEEIWGKPVTEEEIRNALADLSVYDLLRLIGSLSANLVVEPNPISAESQAKLAGFAAAGDADLINRLQRGLNRGQILIFPQQVYHLARLAILGADRRPADGLHQGDLFDKFQRALFGVSDQMGSDIRDDNDVISLELCLTAINHDEERLGQWALYYELFDLIWPTVDGAPNADEAFAKYTGLSIAEYLALGFAVSAGLTRDVGEQPAAWLGIVRRRRREAAELLSVPWLLRGSRSSGLMRNSTSSISPHMSAGRLMAYFTSSPKAQKQKV